MSLIPGMRGFTSTQQFDKLLIHLKTEKEKIEHQRKRLKSRLIKINEDRATYNDELAKVLEEIDAYQVLISSLPKTDQEKYRAEMENLQFRRSSLNLHLRRVASIMELETIVNMAVKERELEFCKSCLRNIEREKRAWIQKQ